jgi:RNAse (barnase) inhibitor barstar
MQLQTVRPNIVQAIRAYRVDDLMQAAEAAGQHFLYANLSESQSKQDVLDKIAESFTVSGPLRQELDALFDCMTDLVHAQAPSLGSWSCSSRLPDNPRFDREAREQLLDVFRDTADYWAERRIPFRCFYSFAVPLAVLSANGPGPHQRGGSSGRKACSEAGAQERPQPELRHEHADDEQRVRYRHVAQRGLTGRAFSGTSVPVAAQCAGVGKAAPSCCARATYSYTGTSSARRCMSNAPS